MNDCTISSIVEAIGNLGVPISLLVVMVYGLYLVGRWFAPRLDKWVDNYLSVQDRRSEMMDKANKACISLQGANITAIRELTAIMHKLEEKLP